MKSNVMNYLRYGILGGFCLFLGVAHARNPQYVDVDFDPNGGTPRPRTLRYAKPFETKFGKLPAVARPGYRFLGWEESMWHDLVSSSDYVGSHLAFVACSSSTRCIGWEPPKVMTLNLVARWGVVAPRPAAADGAKYTYVKVSWPSVPGAVRYKVRRATTADYKKATTITTTKKTSYNDKHPGKRPGKKYYYWVVPYDDVGKGNKDISRYDSGYAHK